MGLPRTGDNQGPGLAPRKVTVNADGHLGTGGGIYWPVFMVTCADIPPSIEIICPVM
jgi:hypothetical protein